MRPGIDLVDDVPGSGAAVERLRTYRLRLRMWLNRGDPVRWTSPWGQVDRAVLEDDGATLVSDIRLHRENLINGVFYGMDGMRIGGSRTLRSRRTWHTGRKAYRALCPATPCSLSRLLSLRNA